MFKDFEDYIVHDITMKMHNAMVCWPGEHHEFNHEYIKSMKRGDKVNISRISSSMHTGTHMDAPHHKIDGQETLDHYHVSNFMGKALVVDLTEIKENIKKKHLENLSLNSYEYLLLKTSNSELLNSNMFHEDYIALDPSGAEHIVKAGIKGICIDYYSIDEYDIENPDSHEIIFKSGLMLYEGVDLRQISHGSYYFIGLPLKIENSEGSLVRAILLEEKNG
jgi:Predicted metal-dependent hydrolase|tara:strand:- start:1739 stop:2401 length:663 start_codon:yes stop_codon:yes gene_type:complete